MTTRDRWLAAVAPLLLVAIAALSIFRFHDVRQSSWQGIGFGMFATYDTRVSRVVRVEIVQDGRAEQVDASSAFGDLVERSRTVPNGPDPEELARRILARTGSDRVVVEVWAIDVARGDGETTISIDPIRTTEAP